MIDSGFVLQYGPVLAVLNAAITNKRIRKFHTRAFVRTSMNFAHLASFQAIEFVDQPAPKALDTSEDKAFFTKGSFLYAKCEEQEHELQNMKSHH